MDSRAAAGGMEPVAQVLEGLSAVAAHHRAGGTAHQDNLKGCVGTSALGEAAVWGGSREDLAVGGAQEAQGVQAGQGALRGDPTSPALQCSEAWPAEVGVCHIPAMLTQLVSANLWFAPCQ